jgi:hypothetical protein
MKMKIMFAVAPILLSSLAFAQGGNLKITPEMLQFDYATIEGDTTLDCKPTLENSETQDWLVQCGTPATSIRKYRVHLWVTLYERAVTPKQSYEVLYWITDLSPGVSPQASASSTTIWFNFENPSTFTELDLRLGVENDNAGLHMTITPTRSKPTQI